MMDLLITPMLSSTNILAAILPYATSSPTSRRRTAAYQQRAIEPSSPRRENISFRLMQMTGYLLKPLL